MDAMDVRRVYGGSDGSGEEPALRPDRVYAELLGGPLDGLLLEDGRRITEKLWSLTPAGLEAAAVVLWSL
ncbi:hypothetical protein [Streptomyces sp. NPDC093093]|uniref:hypothetical protein n=1 Tax=Streptomyces sp. NPDC093093 TaxID=3366025 RepID=UPI003815A0C0